jgi:hypothetical protein
MRHLLSRAEWHLYCCENCGPMGLIIEFRDPQYGRRVGYIHCGHVMYVVEHTDAQAEASSPLEATSPAPSREPAPRRPAAEPSAVRVLPLQTAGKPETLNGYVEWWLDDYLVADGQRVRWSRATKLRLDKFRSLSDAPLGSEVSVRGGRLHDGSLLATELTVKPTAVAAFKRDAVTSSDAFETLGLQRGALLESGGKAGVRSVGALIETGPEVDRVRAVLDRLLPAYVTRVGQ